MTPPARRSYGAARGEDLPRGSETLPRIAVLAVIVTIAALTAAGCLPDGPRVLSTSPGQGATGLAVSASLHLRFDRAMETSSLSTAITLTPAPPAGLAISAAEEYTSAILVPREPLRPDTVYTLTVSREARDREGRRLRKAVTVTFRTAAPRQAACDSPVWSPDGTHLAWLEDSADGRSLWVASSDGARARRLTGNVWTQSKAAWTPDGTGLVVSIRSGEGPQTRPLLARIDIGPAAAPEPLALNSALLDPDQLTVAFSPDGKWMAVQNDMYMADAHSDYFRQLGVARSDGSGVVFFGNLLVGWSADSSSLIYLDMPGVGEGHRFDYEVWRYTISTGVKTRIAAAGAVRNLGTVARAPEGTHFVFADWEAEDVQTADGWEIIRLPRDIWLMSADGLRAVRLTDGTSHNAHPSPAPGGKIAFASDRASGDGRPDWDIWLMSAPEPGSQVTNLTRRVGYDGQPAFSPSGGTIAYVSDATGNPEIWLLETGGSFVTRVISGIEGSAGP